MQVKGMSKGFKKELWIFFTAISVIAVGLFVFFAIALNDDKYSVKTQYGDRFDVIFDDFSAKSIVTPDKSAPEANVNICIKRKVTKDDFVCLKHTDSLTVYRLDERVIFDKGDGFDVFDKQTDIAAHRDVVQVIKDNLHCSEAFYKRYKDLV